MGCGPSKSVKSPHLILSLFIGSTLMFADTGHYSLSGGCQKFNDPGDSLVVPTRRCSALNVKASSFSIPVSCFDLLFRQLWSFFIKN